MTAFRSTRNVRLLAALAAIASLSLVASLAQAQQAFKSPDDAASALVAAVKSGMKQDVLKVLGAEGEDIIDSGDDVADADARAKFLSAYDAKHSLKVDGKRASLIIGADDLHCFVAGRCFFDPVTEMAENQSVDSPGIIVVFGKHDDRGRFPP